MKEVYGNLWNYPAQARVITTNGFVKKDGTAVMGRGCAKEAAKKYPQLPEALGMRIQEHGLTVEVFGLSETIIAFPVKYNWYEKASVELIAQSTVELLEKANTRREEPWRTIVMPRPGCGNGGLWWGDVKLLLEQILDDRFHVITFEDKSLKLPGDASN